MFNGAGRTGKQSRGDDENGPFPGSNLSPAEVTESAIESGRAN